MNLFPMNALYAALAELCPIDGFSIGNPADRASWRIEFSDDATEAQRAAAFAVLAAFDPEPAEQPQVLSKLSIVDRLSDAELEIFVALRSGTASVPLTPAQQIRLALRWDNANEIDRLTQDVRMAFAAVFGPARMTELLGS